MMKKLLFVCTALLSFHLFAKTITPQQLSSVFKQYHACFILYNMNKNKIVSEYNPNNRCHERISPDSTFKVALSLMAFDQGIIKKDTVFKWNGVKGLIPEHDQNQSPLTWIKYSVVWVSQQLTPKLGKARIQHYLADFNYGNQDFSGDPETKNGLTQAWLSSSLKISATEQLELLKSLFNETLPVSKFAMAQTKNNLYLGKLDNGADYFGKTGSGRHGRNAKEASQSPLRDGWFIGYVEQGNQRYIFVSNLTDKKMQATIDQSDGSLRPFGGQILKPITLDLLNNFFSS